MLFSLSALWWTRIRGLWKLPDGIDWLRVILGLVLMGGATLSKSLIKFSVDGWSCVPSLLFIWAQTMVEVMKTTVTSCKRSHACTAAVRAPNLAADHHQPMPLLGTPGHPQASPGQSPVESLFLSPGCWCTTFCSALQETISQSYVSSGSSVVGSMATSSKRTYAIPTPRAPVLAHTTDDLYRHTRHSNTVLSQCLWGPWVLVPTRFVWALWASLARMGFDSKCEFAPPTILLGLLLCPWVWCISSQTLQCPPSYWDFSYLGHGVSIQGCFSEMQAPLLTLDVRNVLLAAPVLRSCHSLLQCCAAVVWKGKKIGHWKMNSPGQ